jgi:hypothetical protein
MIKGLPLAIKAGVIFGLLAAAAMTLSFATIKVNEYPPSKLSHELGLEGEDDGVTYTYREFSYTPDETCQYMFEDTKSHDINSDTGTGITILAPDGKTVIGEDKGKGFSLIADLVEGDQYKVVVKDYDMDFAGETVITKVKPLNGNQVNIQNSKNSWSPAYDWSQVFTLDVDHKSKSAFMLKLANGAVKGADLSRFITMTVYDSGWNKVGKPVKKVLNGSEKACVISLDEGKYFVKLDIHIKKVDDVGRLTWDVMEDMGDGSEQICVADGYDLLTSSTFTPSVGGSYTFAADKRAVRVSVEKNGTNIASGNGKSVSARLKSGVEYNVYFHTSPSEDREIAISACLTPPTVEVRNSKSSLVRGGGYLNSAASVKVSGENMIGVKVKLGGKYIKWTGSGTFKDEGRYEVLAYYTSGEVYSQLFTIDLKKPSISVKDTSGRAIVSGSEVKGVASVKSYDRNPGSKRITLGGKAAPWPTGGKLSVPGKYVVTSYDKAGNVSVFRFTLVKQI